MTDMTRRLTLHVHALLFPKLCREILNFLCQTALDVLRRHDFHPRGLPTRLDGADESGASPKVLDVKLELATSASAYLCDIARLPLDLSLFRRPICEPGQDVFRMQLVQRGDCGELNGRVPEDGYALFPLALLRISSTSSLISTLRSSAPTVLRSTPRNAPFRRETLDVHSGRWTAQQPFVLLLGDIVCETICGR
jgi:hypothetical protein